MRGSSQLFGKSDPSCGSSMHGPAPLGFPNVPTGVPIVPTSKSGHGPLHDSRMIGVLPPLPVPPDEPPPPVWLLVLTPAHPRAAARATHARRSVRGHRNVSSSARGVCATGSSVRPGTARPSRGGRVLRHDEASSYLDRSPCVSPSHAAAPHRWSAGVSGGQRGEGRQEGVTAPL